MTYLHTSKTVSTDFVQIFTAELSSVNGVQSRAIPSCNMSAGIMAPPLLPVGVATQLPGRYALQSAMCGGELDLRALKTSTSRQSTSSDLPTSVIASASSLGWTPRQADPSFCRKVN